VLTTAHSKTPAPDALNSAVAAYDKYSVCHNSRGSQRNIFTEIWFVECTHHCRKSKHMRGTI